MGEASPFFSPAPYHILSYGTLLGTTFFHTFVNSIQMIRVLERPQFSIMQQKLFPVYFGLQSAIPVVLALTYPARSTLLGGSQWDPAAVLDGSVRWSVLAPLATMFLSGLINWVYLLPATKKVMAERWAQEKRDGKKSYDAGPQSEEMKALNKKFGAVHGVSSLLNLTTFIAQLVYAFSLAARMQ